MESWLLLLSHMSTDDPAARMRVLRTLESLGAGLIRDGAYLLPNSEGNRKSLEALAEYINKAGGSAHVMNAKPTSEAQQGSFVRLFDRSARYQDLVKTVESLRLGFGQADPNAIARVLQKQRRELEGIASLDFFPNASRTRAEQALVAAEAEVRNLIFSSEAQASLGPGESLLRRTWATRKPLWADRLASAWLIRRFVDPEATVVFLEKGDALPPRAVAFGFDGAHFHNSRTGVTYEEMLVRLELTKNAALMKIGSIVHFAEVGGEPVPEAAGVQTLLQGALRRSPSDAELLAEVEKTFDLLYEAYYEPQRR